MINSCDFILVSYKVAGIYSDFLIGVRNLWFLVLLLYFWFGLVVGNDICKALVA